MTDSHHVAYLDQLEETIRHRGPVSTPVLCSLMPLTPALKSHVEEHGCDPPAPMPQAWLNPYLRILAGEGRIRWNGVFGWVAGSPTTPEGLRDPTSDVVSDTPTPDGGRPEG